jgi:hypothetical protein
MNVSAQNISYLDADYKPATATSYTYKRIIKYKEPIMNPNIGTGYYGNITVNPQPTGLHLCSLIDYYRTGEPALVANILSGDISCSQLGGIDGLAIYYFNSGSIKRKEPYKAGKLQGTVITYNENGTEQKREDYENGLLIEANRFSVSQDNPLVGIWKYEERSAPIVNRDLNINIPGSLIKLITAKFFQNGILEITVQGAFINGQSFSGGQEKTNWKYISKSVAFGVLEQYQGNEMLYRGNVRWINSNQFEYTNTFHPDANLVGQKYTYTRQ